MATPKDPAANLDILIRQGAGFSLTLKNIKDGSGTPLDYSAYRACLQIRPDPDSSTIYLDFRTSNNPGGTSGCDITITFDNVNGSQILIHASDAVTEAIIWDGGVYDLYLHPVSGDSICLIEGSVTVVKAVSKGC